MFKRGVSGVIVVILMILISIVSISIVWVFVQPSILEVLSGNNGESALGRLVSCSNLDLRAVLCSNQSEIYSVLVERGAGSFNLSQINFELTDSNGMKFVVPENNVLSEFGNKIYSFNSSNISSYRIISVDVAGVIGENICGFPGLPVFCSENSLESFGNETNETNQTSEGCGDLNFVYLDDFNESTCTRTRNGLIPQGVDKLPSAGLRVVAPDWNSAAATGATLGRDIIQWYDVYDSLDANANLNFTSLDRRIKNYKDANMKVILTLRANHPNRSEFSFDLGGRTLFEDDSWPKFGQEDDWVNYLKNVTDRYYVHPDSAHSGVLAGIQIGNEWSHQFVINGSYGRYSSNQRDKAILDLMNLSYTSIREISPDIPIISFALSGANNWVLASGWNEEGWTYDGVYYNSGTGKNDIRVLKENDVSPSVLKSIEVVLINGSKFYDYLDIHMYFQTPHEARYAANYVRSVWKDNGMKGKGLVSTEFATPMYNYSYNLHSYSIKAGQAVAYHSGFDSIVWANWNPTQGSANLLQTSMKYDQSSGYQTSQIANYTYFQTLSKDFVNISRNNDLIVFNLGSDITDINLSLGVPQYPSIYECSDGLDNDNDGLIDSNDSDCYDFYNLNDPAKCNGQKKQTANCVDPEGFSESNWIFTF